MKNFYLFLIILLIPAMARANDGSFDHMMNWQSWNSGFMFIYPLFWILILAALVYLLSKASSRKNKSHFVEEDKGALEILKERYAKGEIDKEKFEEMKKDIK